MKAEKTILLLAVSILTITAFFLLPQNTSWMGGRVIHYWKDFQKQKVKLDIEERKGSRYSDAYLVSINIAKAFPENKKKEVLVLLPSETYFKKYGVSYEVPEPAVFYYFTGVKTTWANSPLAVKANWIAGVRDGKVVTDSVINYNQLTDSISQYQKSSYPL